MRVNIQNVIIDVIEKGVYPIVKYVGNKPSLNGVYASTPKIWVNETQATIDTSSKNNSQDGAMNLGPWIFQAIVDFDREVDISTFVREKLAKFNFSDGEYLVSIKAGGYTVVHPVTGGGHTGTHAVINLTATTRR